MSSFTSRHLLEALTQIAHRLTAEGSKPAVLNGLIGLSEPIKVHVSPEPEIKKIADAGRYLVAYSGGMDSHVLLHAIAALRERLSGQLVAVHIDHGLNPQSSRWSEHCQHKCVELDISFVSLKVDARHEPGESPESAARKSRYSAFNAFMQNNDCLLTAHHQDDQAETVLLQLLRGGGPHGLSAMPELKILKKGFHIRPLLGFDRAALLDYAKTHHLSWLEDPSNAEINFARNYLRHEVMPNLRKQWPGFSLTVSRSASLCSDAAHLIDEVAADDLSAVITTDKSVISLESFSVYSENRQRNILRYWFVLLGLSQPNMKHIKKILDDILTARGDRNPVVTWGDVEVRRYRGLMYAMEKLQSFDRGAVKEWVFEQSSDLEFAGGLLCAEKTEGQGLDYSLFQAGKVTVKCRSGGERCRAVGQVHHTELKKIFQQRAVPPWWRDRIPLIYINNELAAIAGLLVCDTFSAKSGQAGLNLSWYQK